MIASASRRRALLAVLVLVIVACLGAAALVVATRSAGEGLGDRLSSLRDDDVPASAEVRDREQLLKLASDFVTRFNTYGPDMLDDQGHLPDYVAVGDLMTAKFGAVFDENVELAEQTVAQLAAASTCTVYATGVVSQDGDSAEVLVAGTIELSYVYNEDQGGGNAPDDGDTGEDEEDPRVSTGPQAVRYEVSLVKIDGEWLVDDLDDIDDGRPSLSQPAIPEETTPPGSSPSATPTDTASSASPTTEETGEGER